MASKLSSYVSNRPEVSVFGYLMVNKYKSMVNRHHRKFLSAICILNKTQIRNHFSVQKQHKYFKMLAALPCFEGRQSFFDESDTLES